MSETQISSSSEAGCPVLSVFLNGKASESCTTRLPSDSKSKQAKVCPTTIIEPTSAALEVPLGKIYYLPPLLDLGNDFR